MNEITGVKFAAYNHLIWWITIQRATAVGQVATQLSAIAVLELSFRRWCSSNDIFVDLLTHVVDVQKCLECNPSLSQSVSKQATSILYCWTTFQQSNHDFRSLMKTSRLALGKVRKIRPPPATSGELGMIYRPHGDVSSPCYSGRRGPRLVWWFFGYFWYFRRPLFSKWRRHHVQ